MVKSVRILQVTIENCEDCPNHLTCEPYHMQVRSEESDPEIPYDCPLEEAFIIQSKKQEAGE